MQIRPYQTSDEREVIKFYQNIGYYDENVISLGKRLIPDKEYILKDDLGK